MSTFEIVIFAGGFIGGLVNGLAGFGTGLVALNFWLYAVPPIVAAPMVIICSLVGQLQTFPKIWRTISWPRVMPFIIGGIGGIPIGTYILPYIPVDVFKVMVGGILIIYCGYMLLSGKNFNLQFGGRFMDGIVGFIGGVLGGIAGLSGPAPSIWAGIRGWRKEDRRAMFQAFNTSILSIALASQALSGFVTLDVGWAIMFALPGTLLGVWLGHKLYIRLGDRGFDRAVYTLLLLAGITLVTFTLYPIG